MHASQRHHVLQRTWTNSHATKCPVGRGAISLCKWIDNATAKKAGHFFDGTVSGYPPRLLIQISDYGRSQGNSFLEKLTASFARLSKY